MSGYTHELKSMQELSAMLNTNLVLFEKMSSKNLVCATTMYAERIIHCEQMIARREHLALKELNHHIFGDKDDFDYWKRELLQ